MQNYTVIVQITGNLTNMMCDMRVTSSIQTCWITCAQKVAACAPWAHVATFTHTHISHLYTCMYI